MQSTISIPRLRAALNGRVITPGDTGYDHARTVFYGGFDRRPQMIVRPADAAEVARGRGTRSCPGSGSTSPTGSTPTTGRGPWRSCSTAAPSCWPTPSCSVPATSRRPGQLLHRRYPGRPGAPPAGPRPNRGAGLPGATRQAPGLPAADGLAPWLGLGGAQRLPPRPGRLGPRAAGPGDRAAPGRAAADRENFPRTIARRSKRWSGT
jgi:hypothetical protein